MCIRDRCNNAGIINDVGIWYTNHALTIDANVKSPLSRSKDGMEEERGELYTNGGIWCTNVH